jgi:sigma-E factor negative regulatory protein RseC
MEQLVKVKTASPDGTAQVIRIRESACSGDCHKCSGCGAAKETIVFTAENPVNAQPGDLVYVKTQSAPVLMGAAVVYLLPLLLFFLGYFLLDAMWSLGALGGGLAFALGIGGVVMYDRLVARKQNTVYTIVGYAHKLDT